MLLFAEVSQYVFGILMFVTSLFLILLVLVQRGRGGGLAGALGGMGGQSAFGTKAGDTFTKVTVTAATFWILLCLASVWVLGRQSNKLGATGDGAVIPSPTPTERRPHPSIRVSQAYPWNPERTVVRLWEKRLFRTPRVPAARMPGRQCLHKHRSHNS